MELATTLGAAKSGGLILAAIAHVFTISYVANQLDEDEDWLFELSSDMFPEDGCLWVYGVGEDGVPAFTKDGIENLRQIIADERAAGHDPPAANARIAQPAVLTACLPFSFAPGLEIPIKRRRICAGKENDAALPRFIVSLAIESTRARYWISHSQTVFDCPNPDERRVIAAWLAFGVALSPELLLRFQH